MFNSIFGQTGATLSYQDGILCLLTAVAVGVIIALTASFCEKHTRSMVMSLVFLPAIVAVVIIMVNGNLGTGVAIAGAFSLVRFRSVPGKAMDICMIFLAMAMGLAVGIGYLTYALAGTVLLCLIITIMYKAGFATERKTPKLWHVSVPESLNYTTAFDEVFQEFKAEAKLIQVKTSNMGSIYHLTYEIMPFSIDKEKEMLDAIRCRNGNLPVSIMLPGENAEIL